jgi:hypothetical protein
VPRARKSSKAATGRKPTTAATRDLARTRLIARKLARTETIKRSASNLMEARAYLDGLRAGIDGLLKNAFPEGAQKESE